MILSDVSIREALECGRIKIDPAPKEEQFDTSSLDLRLGSEFKKYSDSRSGEETIIDPSKKQYSIRAVERQEDVRPYESDGSILVKPGNFVLGMTEEWITLPSKSRIAARIEGKSGLARLGLSVHLTAPTIQSGFDGRLVLEIKNHDRFIIRLTPGMLICQLIFEQLDQRPSGEIGTLFQGQDSPEFVRAPTNS